MVGALVEHRVLVSLACSGVVGTVGLHVWPFPAHDALLGLVALHRPRLFAGLSYTYATLWFTTPCLLLNVVASLLYIFVARMDRTASPQRLPPYPDPRTRADLYLVLGEQHHRGTPGRASRPQWLVISERGLYTGMAIIGAIGTGKTSACMYPYVEQLLAYRAGDGARKVGGSSWK